MKRIVQVFGKLDRGGAETLMMNYYRNINRDELQFDFVVNFPQEGAYESEIKQLGGRIYRTPRFKGYNLISFIWAWYTLLKRHPEWDMLHVHHFKIGGLILAVASLLGRKGRIVHMHTSNPVYPFPRNIGYLLSKRLAARFATHRLACSQLAGECYYDQSSFQVITNAIETQRYEFSEEIRNQKRAELGFQNEFVIGHVGNMSPRKNHHMIILIFAELAKLDPSARLLLVGGGELLEQVKEHTETLGLSSKVIFAESRSDVPELLMGMDVFLFPSVCEGLPVALVEAQASGLPVLMADHITDDVILSSLIHKQSIEATPQLWATQLLEIKNSSKDRRSATQFIYESGYDVEKNVIKLQHQIYSC